MRISKAVSVSTLAALISTGTACKQRNAHQGSRLANEAANASSGIDSPLCDKEIESRDKRAELVKLIEFLREYALSAKDPVALAMLEEALKFSENSQNKPNTAEALNALIANLKNQKLDLNELVKDGGTVDSAKVKEFIDAWSSQRRQEIELRINQEIRKLVSDPNSGMREMLAELKGRDIDPSSLKGDLYARAEANIIFQLLEEVGGGKTQKNDIQSSADIDVATQETRTGVKDPALATELAGIFKARLIAYSKEQIPEVVLRASKLEVPEAQKAISDGFVEVAVALLPTDPVASDQATQASIDLSPNAKQPKIAQYELAMKVANRLKVLASNDKNTPEDHLRYAEAYQKMRFEFETESGSSAYDPISSDKLRGTLDEIRRAADAAKNSQPSKLDPAKIAEFHQEIAREISKKEVRLVPKKGAFR